MAIAYIILGLVFYIIIGATILSMVIMPYETEEDAKMRLRLVAPELSILFEIATFGAVLYIHLFSFSKK